MLQDYKQQLISAGWGPPIEEDAEDLIMFGDDSDDDDWVPGMSESAGDSGWRQYIQHDGVSSTRLWQLDLDNKCGDKSAAASKRSVLLSPVIGVTDTNYMLNSFMGSFLVEYGTLSTRAQYTKQPVSAQMGRQILRLDRVLNSAFVVNIVHRRFPPQYEVVRQLLLAERPAKLSLVKAVDAYASQIVESFLQDFWHRLKDGGSHTESNPGPCW